MSKSEFVNKITRTAGNFKLGLKKRSPEILVFTGIAGTVFATAMACKASTKLGDILDEAKETIDAIHHYTEHPEELPEEYTPEDGKKDLVKVYIQTGVKVIKLYGPSAVVGIASISSILAGHNILRKRNAALAAAYAVVDKSFKEYRGRVVERFGKEIDHELRYNIKAKEIEETIVDENGNETTVVSTVDVIDPNTLSDFTRVYDDGCTGWSKNPEFNMMFLKRQQEWANNKLKQQGHLFFNEVLDMLGYPRTALGAVSGWTYEKNNPDSDGFVDFGIFDINKERNRAFINGYERNILLEFNCEADILAYI